MRKASGNSEELNNALVVLLIAKSYELAICKICRVQFRRRDLDLRRLLQKRPPCLGKHANVSVVISKTDPQGRYAITEGDTVEGFNAPSSPIQTRGSAPRICCVDAKLQLLNSILNV